MNAITVSSLQFLRWDGGVAIYRAPVGLSPRTVFLLLTAIVGTGPSQPRHAEAHGMDGRTVAEARVA